MISITAKFHGELSDMLGEEIAIDVPDTLATAEGVQGLLARTHAQAGGTLPGAAVVLNGEAVDVGVALSDGDTVEFG